MENPWRVRVDDAGGTPRGAGVLLDGRNVLTCAHVVRNAGAAPGGAASHVRVTSVACHPEWSVTARVDPDSWVYRNGTRRGDVALLTLDEPAPCDAGTKLWLAPISGGRVRVYGFPQIEPYGIAADAELAGSGSREGEWAVLNRVHSAGQWIEEGFSGAGVLALDGEFAGRVIGIVVADYVAGDARAAWMLPTETIHNYLRDHLPTGRYIAGEPATVLPPGGTPPDPGLDDPLRLALTQELTRLLTGGWTGAVVLTGGATGTGTSWLVRLVRTADPAARAGVSDVELSGAPRDTVLGLGAVDAAYDARGRSLAEVRRYLADRFGFPEDAPDLLHRLLRRKPPACLVIGGVDRAADPEALVGRLLGPLASRARTRGIRLVLGFDGQPPAGLAYEVSLGPEPIGGRSLRPAAREDAERGVARLAAAEEAASALHTEWGLMFFGPPPLPPCRAPQLRVRLAVARGAEPDGELALIRDDAVASLDGVERFEHGMRRLVARYEDLLRTLEVNRVRSQRFFGAEDLRLAALHDSAARTLRTVPVDLRAAAVAVDRYKDEVNRRVEEERARGQV